MGAYMRYSQRRDVDHMIRNQVTLGFVGNRAILRDRMSPVHMSRSKMGFNRQEWMQ